MALGEQKTVTAMAPDFGSMAGMAYEPGRFDAGRTTAFTNEVLSRCEPHLACIFFLLFAVYSER